MNSDTLLTARILRIEKISPNDGEGMRTVIFFKGCPLRCRWCAAPESQKACFETYTDKNGRRQIYGREMSPDQVMKKIRADEVFYFYSEGGVTLSGGDVLLQSEFALALLEKCKESEINTAAELDMEADYEKIAALLPFLDSLYADIKHMNPERHKYWTGKTNERILENIKKASAEFKGSFHVRVPLVPGVNDTKKNLSETAAFCGSLENIADLEFLPFHRLGLAAYENLGLDYDFKDMPAMGFDKAYELVKAALGEKTDFPVKISGRVI